MREQYKEFSFRSDTLVLIDIMNAVINDYMRQGFVLTVRQLYYQLVQAGHIPNTERSYKRITGVVNDARLAGLMDWDAIEDRTREFISRSHWNSGSEILQTCADSFHMDMWENQDVRVFVIVEKEALAGVLEQACHRWDVPLLAARGYPSGTVLREFVEQRILPTGQNAIILHLGDHDPSGIDMSRDLEERLNLFSRGDCDILFHRIALNMQQIDELKPPPNPAKSTDSRFKDYRRKFGSESWELDALQPAYLTRLINENVSQYVDDSAWSESEEKIATLKDRLQEATDDFKEKEDE